VLTSSREVDECQPLASGGVRKAGGMFGAMLGDISDDDSDDEDEEDVAPTKKAAPKTKIAPKKK